RRLLELMRRQTGSVGSPFGEADTTLRSPLGEADTSLRSPLGETDIILRRPRPVKAAPAPRQLTAPFCMIAAEDRRRLPENVEDAYPLTMVQLGMLYHMELTPDASTPAYHNVNSFHLRSHLEMAAFEEAVERVVARHPILRTAFDLTSYSEPLQLVHRAA